jgi:hypothetical protein
MCASEHMRTLNGFRTAEDLLLLLTKQSFNADIVQIMREAYDAASRQLPHFGQPALVGEVLAKQIISIASNGERDPQALARRALKELGVAGSENIRPQRRLG